MVDIISRAEWGARPPKSRGNAINDNPDGCAVHWEGPSMGTRKHSECAALMRSIQRFHMDSRGWADIAYSFCVCEHGYVYEGRGLTRGSAANGSTSANARWYAICALVGKGDPHRPELFAGIAACINYCRDNGAGSKVCGHRDLTATECPGSTLYAWVGKGVPRTTTTAPVVEPPPPAPAPSEEDELMSLMVKHPTLKGVVWPIESALWSMWTYAYNGARDGAAALEIAKRQAAAGRPLTVEETEQAVKDAIVDLVTPPAPPAPKVTP